MASKLIRKVFCGHEIKGINTEDFTAEVVMSDETLDRYDEIIEVSAYDNTIKQFMKHPVLLSSHRYSGDLRSQIGEWTKVYKDGSKLVGVAKYYVGEGNPEADWAWKLVEKGVAAYSVGLIPKKVETMDWEKWQELKDKGKKVARRRYKEVELIETSHVLIPANPSALQRSIDGDDDAMKDVASFYLSHLADIKDFADMEVIESDIAEKFLVKDPTDVIEEEDHPLIIVPEDNTVVIKLDELSKKVDAILEVMTKSTELVSVELGTIQNVLTINSIKEIIDASTKELLEKITGMLNVKTIVPEQSYLDALLDDKEDVTDKSVDASQLKSLMETLSGITDTIKKSVNKE